MLTAHALRLGCIALLAAAPTAQRLPARTPAQPSASPFTEQFFLEECRFASTGSNLFFSIEPGYQLRFEGEEDGVPLELTITVLNKVRDIPVIFDGQAQVVRTRVIEEREYVDGEIREVSRNYYARCKRTDTIFYFGEIVKIYDNGQLVSREGSWLAGVDGASPGIIMPGTFLLGSKYFQETAPGVALDRAEHTEMGVTLDVPAGAFDDCVVVSEDSALGPGAESRKVYAPGVGLVQSSDLHLVSYGFVTNIP